MVDAKLSITIHSNSTYDSKFSRHKLPKILTFVTLEKSAHWVHLNFSISD